MPCNEYAMTFRTEKYTMGEMEVSEGIYYCSQTAHSFPNFDIGIEKIPQQLIVAFRLLKKTARVARKTPVEGTKLKDSAVTLGSLSTEEFDRTAAPTRTTIPQKSDIEKPGRTEKA